MGTIFVFFILLPTFYFYQNSLMKQPINAEAKIQLKGYLRHFTTTFIKKPYGIKRIRLKALKTKDNKQYVHTLYKEAMNDHMISYYELVYMARKISDHQRLER